ncbi:DUF1993 family protein [Crocosphaera chwakensis]|uniref:DUF1993 domain-containing protein n=1 Tax=Crocosphaera chwakensis CCY0110 TaxID=391612 RepID=A3IR65_9CHRO|nr:DUF1993 family protein [Crocosphaera chwakensis]EAZ91055.1 hypothetical protein CY0110_27625 [Crocosphaera chwakensis CCY0110]
MKSLKSKSIKSIFISRLETLEHLIEKGAKHFESEPDKIFGLQLISDMHALGTQVVFTCNQPHNFSLWCEGKKNQNIDIYIKTVSQAKELISEVKAHLDRIMIQDSKFSEITTLELGDSMYLELSGEAYLEEFLMPTFYFHLVTVYDILRMSGVQIGKRDYMLHLVPKVRQREV